MRKKLLWFCISLGVLGLGAWMFFSVFEVVEDERYFPPSREARLNDYLAMDRWLGAEGHAVRVVTRGNLETLKTAAEGTIFIQSELFDWNEAALEYLEAWVRSGGSLILCLGYYRSWDTDEELGLFLSRLGLEADTSWNTRVYDPLAPSFGRNIQFIISEGETAGDNLTLTLKDPNGFIRLVQYTMGRGKIAVTSRPQFMMTLRLDEEPNARLSWYLLAGDASGRVNGDILFIRGERQGEGIMGRVFQLGNFAVIIISALVLVVVGFWSVIPQFGVIKGIEEKSGKGLTERFLAEGRFLARFGALDTYRNVYFREIRRRLLKRENLRDEEIIPRAAFLFDGGNMGIRAVEQAIAPGPQRKNDFTKSIEILKTILERL